MFCPTQDQNTGVLIAIKKGGKESNVVCYKQVWAKVPILGRVGKKDADEVWLKTNLGEATKLVRRDKTKGMEREWMVGTWMDVTRGGYTAT